MGGKFDDIEKDHTGRPPRKVTSGAPSSDVSVNASEIMQNMIMNDDDKEHYRKLAKVTGPATRMKQASRAARSLSSVSSIPHGFDIGLNCSYERSEASLQEEIMGLCLGCAVGLCRVKLHEARRKENKKHGENLLMEPDDLDAKRKREKKKQTKEVNAVAGGNVSGYTGPLGKRAQRKLAKFSARAFGGGKVVG